MDANNQLQHLYSLRDDRPFTTDNNDDLEAMIVSEEQRQNKHHKEAKLKIKPKDTK